ncbi:SDR family oxidoreductase [Pontixanthobacter gangjinensis]|uniref:SDR family oxidoreductase n=1 Tax=Pontixanthobacter gangjinensis TaxID=1028742 RepID=A0A6I4SLC9_9SPHN|nr:SDR family oxidoreductase [Pontixanthobacter gangjinensis]MXO56701.1 SDR family oxidoreductase [Pontixanthobacter gangjinensis]
MKRQAVLVTGGAIRLGRSISEEFAARGWHVIIHYRSSAREAQILADSLPSAETITFDLCDHHAVERAAIDLANRVPEWRALICSASLFEPDSADQANWEVWDKVQNANLRGNVALAQTFLKRSQFGNAKSAVFLLDQKLENMNPDFFSYTLSKAGLHAAAQMMAMQEQFSKDRIYSLAPGLTLPSHDQTEAEFARSASMNLLQRVTQAEETARAACFLADGHLASGGTLLVDSGQHLLNHRRDVMYLVREEN